MQSEKVTLIQLGGKIHANRLIQKHDSVNKSSNSKNKNSSCNISQLNDSKERIQSNQRISHKISPIKRKQTLYRNQNNKQGYQTANSYTQAQSSTISIVNQSINNPNMHINNRNYPQTFSQPSRQFIKANFVNNCVNGEKTLSSNLRELNNSPSKVILSNKIPVMECRQVQLERKVKILENRVGEIHKQKHDMMGKLNEQNRKIYHQNTALKLKINDLCKQLDIRKNEIATCKKTDEQKDNIDNSPYEVQCLKRQIQECQILLEQQSLKYISVLNKYLALQLKFKQKQQENKNLKTQIQKEKYIIKTKDKNIDQLQKAYEKTIFQNKEHQKIKKDFQKDIENIKLQMIQNNERNNQIIEGYKLKLDQYQLAYNQNQEVIQQLTQTIAYLQTQPNKYQQKQYQTEKGQQTINEVQNECQLLEQNLHSALQARDQTIQQLQMQIRQIQSEYEQKGLQFQQLIVQNQQKQQKLQQISLMLQKYNDKFKQMENKYEQLSIRYENEKQKLVKIQNPSQNQRQKCKKCDELLKTIFRLNNHLNTKKAQ